MTPQLLLLFFVHGFKGNDATFEDYPSRLQHNLSNLLTEDKHVVESHVYPAYQTRGDLAKCVDGFVDWLVERVAEREMEHAAKVGSKQVARIILLGHSMGGLVISDAALQIAHGWSAASEESIWPRIIGLIAYDTPYLGLHPSTFANQAETALSYASQAKAVADTLGMGWAALGIGGDAAQAKSDSKGKSREVVPASPDGSANKGKNWTTWGAAAAGGAALAAAAGTAWYQRNAIAEGTSTAQLWVSSHLEFVGALWKKEALQARMSKIFTLQHQNVNFHCFYTLLPKSNRTFILLPTPNTLPDVYDREQALKAFTPARNSEAASEIDAHTTMFTIAKNDGIHQLNKETVKLILSWYRAETGR